MRILRFRKTLVLAAILVSGLVLLGISRAYADTLYTYSGTLTNASGEPISNVSLRLISDTGSDAISCSDANGNFSIQTTPGIHKLLIVSFCGSDPSGLPTVRNINLTGVSSDIDLTAGDLHQNLQLTTSTVTVNVRDSNGNPIPDAYINAQTYQGATSRVSNGPNDLIPIDRPSAFTAISKNTDSNVNTTINVLKGLQFNVIDGSASNNSNICAYLPVSGQAKCMSAPLTVNGDTTVNLVFEPVHTYSGSVKNSDGQGVSGLSVQLLRQNGEAATFCTDSNGNFSMPVVEDVYLLRYASFCDSSDHNLPTARNMYFNTKTADVDLHSDLNQNLQLNMAKLAIVAKDMNGAVIQDAYAIAQTYQGATTRMANGPYDLFPYAMPGAFTAISKNTDSTGSTLLLVPVGLEFSATYAPLSNDGNICVYFPNNSDPTCLSSAVTIRGDTTMIIQEHSPQPDAPANLATHTPTQSPQLAWNAVQTATSYKVYRDSVMIGSTTNENYYDTTASEGSHSYYVTAVNAYGESTPSNTVSAIIDKTSPVVSVISWTNNPLQQGQSTTLSATATDNLSGVKVVNYSIDGGNVQPMSYDPGSGTWKATFGSSLAANTYNITITASDAAENTDSGASDVLAVYTTANGYVTGHAKTSPTTSDTMPISRDASGRARLVLGFTNVTAPTSGSFDLNYSIKNNKDEFSLSSTGIDWVIVQNNTHASILGRATLTTYVNGIKSTTQNEGVRFDIALGANGSPDQITIKLFSPGVNPNTGIPAYVVNDAVIASGSNLMIHP